MKAEATLFVGKIINPEGTLFRIPVYQRNYSWDEEQCKILLDDIEKILKSGKANKGHFLGTMVYIESDENDYQLNNEYIVIDGQQRLTTIMIFLKALQDCIKNYNDENNISDKINDILYNKHSGEHFRIKLHSPSSDYEKFTSLLEDKHDKLDESDRIFKNYKVCLNRVNQWLEEGFAADKILWAVKQIEVVKIEMDNNDDQQAIFESLNSTGLNLSNADLIRNFLLMKESPSKQKILFDNWQVIERNLKADESDEDINNFFAHYITFTDGTSAREINKKILYRRFVDLFDEKNLTRSDILAELKKLSGIYSAFVNKDSKKKYPSDVMKYLENLRTLKQTTCYPFLLHVFDDYENNIIDSKTLSKTVKFILCYIVRRLVCKISSGSLRGFFAGLYSRTFRIQENKQKYYEAINKFISTQFSNDVMPSDEKFRDSLLNQDIYGKSSPLCRFILEEIENGSSKEVIVFDKKLSIEHIMPQNLSPEWRRAVSNEDHEKFLHTLGNLTITGYNSELGNRSFTEKKALIDSKKSKAVILNSDVLNKESWTVEEIKARAGRLAKIVMKLFKTEKINDPDLKFDYLAKITLDDAGMATGQYLDSFVFDGNEYKQNTFAYMLVDVVKLLDEQKPGILEELARENYSFTSGEKIYLKYGSDSMKNPKEIRDKIFIDTGISSENTMKFIAALFKRFDISKSRFYIFVKTGTNKQD